MPTVQRSIASYWSGSAWVDMVQYGRNADHIASALISFDLEDTLASPTLAVLRIANPSADRADGASSHLNGALGGYGVTAVPVDDGSAFIVGENISIINGSNAFQGYEEMLITAISTNTLTVIRGYRNTIPVPHDDNAPVSGSRNTKGIYTDHFTDFMPIKVRDGESNRVMFSGILYSVKEVYDTSYGMVIEVQCRDYAIELRDNTTDGAYGYKIDTSVATSSSLTNATARDDDKKLWDVGVSSRGGLIKSLISHFTNNLTATGDSNRFVESVANFEEDDVYQLGGRNQKSVLSHIISNAATDPLNTTLNEQAYGYDFYVDPNFTSTAADHKPTAFFNYFKRGERPSAQTLFGATNYYGLNIEHPSSANFAATGQLLPMLDFDFERPRGEVYTDAMVKYTAVSETEDGGTSVEERIVPFEIIQIKAAANLTASVPRWKGLPIAAGHKGFNEDDGVLFPEWLQVEIDSTWTTVARMQYISKTSGITDAAPAFVLISDVNPVLTDTNTYFAEDVVWRGKDNNSTTFTLKSRPRTKYGVRRTLKMATASTGKPQVIRQQIASNLMRSSVQIIRGSFKTYEKPQYYFDNSPSAVSAAAQTQTITLAGSDNPLDNGFRVGMTVAKLTAQDGEVSGLYGYASAVTATTITVTWSSASGVPTTSDYIRYFVPVRAGDLVHLKNNLVNVAGNYLVTKIKYTEQPGISNTHFDVVGRENDKEGGYNRKALLVSALEAATTDINLPPSGPNAGKVSATFAGLDFASSLANQVAWGTGTYNTSTNVFPSNGTLSIGIDQYTMTAGTTATTMVSPADGNTDQIDNQLNEALDNSETAVDVDSGSVFAVNDTIRIDDEHMLITAISTNTLTVTRGYFSSTAATHADDAPVYTTTLNSTEDYYIYYSGSGTALSTIRKNHYRNVADEYTVLIGHCKADTDEAEFTIFVQQIAIPDKGSGAKKISPYSLGSQLSKKGAQPWSTDIKFEGTAWNTVRWYKGQNDDGTAVGDTTTDGTISFGDDTVETISDNTGLAFDAGKTSYIYKTVGASANAALTVTVDYAQAYRDDRVLLALVTVNADATTGDAPTIMPFNGNVQTVSSTAIAANSITAASIKAGAITATEIETNTITTNEINFGVGTTFRQDAPPDANAAGDLWFDTNDGNKTYRASASGTGNWVATVLTKSGIGLGNVDNDSTASIRAVSAATSGTMAGLQVNASKLFFGTGTFNNSNTSFYVDTGGNFSLEDKLSWNGSTLSVDGTITASASSTIPAGIIENHSAHGTNKLQGVDGTAGTPGYSFSGDTSTGMYRSGSAVRFSAGGSLELSVGTDAVICYDQLGINDIPVADGTALTINGGIVSQVSSTKRAKMDITKLKLDSSKLYDLQPKSFRFRKDKRTEEGKIIRDEDGFPIYTDEPAGDVTFGLIAEEVNEIFPNLVVKDSKNLPASVRYSLLSVLLVEEIKKLKIRLEKLEGD